MADGARQLCETDWCAIGLLDLAVDALRVRRWRTSPRALADGLAGEPGDPASARSLRAGHPHHGRGPGGPFPSLDPLVTSTRSALTLPIRVDGRLEGLVCVGRHAAGDFSEPDRARLEWLADQAAIAIAHARLLEEAQRQRGEAEELAMLSQVMSQSLDSQEVAQRIVDSMRRLLGAVTCVLYGLESPDDLMLRSLAASGVACDRIPAHPPRTGAVGLALAEFRTVTTPDLLCDTGIPIDPALRDYVRGTDHGAVLAVPLFTGGRAIGALAARGRTRRQWSTDEVRLARLFADQATIALENARLFAESRRQRRTAETLALVARATSRPFDIASLGQQIVDTLLLLIGGARATLFAQEPGRGGFRLVAVARRAELAASGDVTAFEPGPVEAVAARVGRLVTTSDFLAEPSLSAAGEPSGGRERMPLRAVLATPLLHGEAGLGILSVADRAGRRFEADEVNVFLAAADHATVALQSAYLHAQVTETALVQERIRIANELHDTLSQLAFSAGLKLDWCLHRIPGASPLRPKLEDIRRVTGQMMAQIRQLMVHLDKGPGEATFTRRLESLVNEFRELTGAAIEFALAGDPERLTAAAQEAVEKTLQEALVNVAKHARATWVTVRVEVEGDQTAIVIADNGIGLRDDQIEGAGQPGHMGLRQMRERIEALGGRLELRTVSGSGVRVHGVFPLGGAPDSGDHRPLVAG